MLGARGLIVAGALAFAALAAGAFDGTSDLQISGIG
jgi:hypothetical protein